MTTKTILGLDLGSASIGWALIEEKNLKAANIIDLGVRVIPYDGTEGQEFMKGSGESKNASRTTKRSIRKSYDRYQLRRTNLIKHLKSNGFELNDKVRALDKMELWKLRSDAVSKQINKEELARILLWLNQKRGYKSSRADKNLDKKDTEYVVEVKSRDSELEKNGLTIGQHFYTQLLKDPFFRIKENVYSRESYIKEFDKIITKQQEFYTNSIDNNFIDIIRNKTIYYQRPLKSQKGLVSICEFEGFIAKGIDGKKYHAGPKVIPKSSPLFQLSKIWETVNNIEYRDNIGNKYKLTSDQKQKLIDWLDNNEKLSLPKLISLLGLKAGEFFFSKQLERGIQGNLTKSNILKQLVDNKHKDIFLKFEVNTSISEDEVSLVDKNTGELLHSQLKKVVLPNIEKEPLYRLWHIIYSISEQELCIKAIKNLYKELTNGLYELDNSVAYNLSEINLSQAGFGNKSAKCIRKTLPYLIDGYMYSEAMELGGYNHSNSLTIEERNTKTRNRLLDLLPKNSLRQPVVEKILNQMINLVNSIIEKYGYIDEIRVELARELKQSKDERNDTMKYMNKLEKENDLFKKRILELGAAPTRRNVVKYRLLVEASENDVNRLNATCIYCGQPIGISQALNGEMIDVDHIIPKTKLFNDSQSNKVLVHRKCNATKGNMTAFDFMKSKSDLEFQDYIKRVNELAERKLIGKSKRDNLLITEEKIPQNFIERQLRETQYISKKSREILETICPKVWATSGQVTAQLRKLWGWEDVLLQLNKEQYESLGLIKEVEWTSQNGNHTHKSIQLENWSKRDDQRHHALDALTIACTKQGFIQKINTLSSSKTKDEMQKNIEGHLFNEKLSLLEKYLSKNKPFLTEQVAESLSKVLISFKSGKKVAIWGTRKIGRLGNKTIAQKNILVPRGPLSEESIYGKIKLKNILPIKQLFENINQIENHRIKALIQERIDKNKNDIKAAQKSISKDPIYLDQAKQILLEHAVCFVNETVIKYKVDTNFNKVDKVIDKQIKKILKTRLEKFGNNPKEAFKEKLDADGKIQKWFEDEKLKRPIYSVRCSTGLSSVVPIKYNAENEAISFVKPGNNHHVAIYQNIDGEYQENICSFWHAVERKKYKLPIIIKNSNQIWELINETNSTKVEDSFLEMLPEPNLSLILSLQINEMILLGLTNDEIEEAINLNNKSLLSKHLYRVQKLSSSDYYFRHHLATNSDEGKSLVELKKYFRIKSLGSLFKFNPKKARINILGEFSIISEKEG